MSQGDAVEINGGDIRGTILGNTFDGWTRAAVGIYGGNASRLEIGPNAYQTNLAGAFNKTGVALTSANTFRVFVDPSVTSYAPVARGWTPGLPNFDSIRASNRITSRDRKGERSGIGGAKRRNLPVTAAATPVFSLQDFTEAGTVGGLIHVHARSTDVSDALTADYLLFVSDDSNRASQMATISALGYIGGSAANQPSFTWGLAGNVLQATPINNTSGTFFFEATSLGAVAY